MWPLWFHVEMMWKFGSYSYDAWVMINNRLFDAFGPFRASNRSRCLVNIPFESLRIIFGYRLFAKDDWRCEKRWPGRLRDPWAFVSKDCPRTWKSFGILCGGCLLCNLVWPSTKNVPGSLVLGLLPSIPQRRKYKVVPLAEEVWRHRARSSASFLIFKIAFLWGGSFWLALTICILILCEFFFLNNKSRYKWYKYIFQYTHT